MIMDRSQGADIGLVIVNADLTVGAEDLLSGDATMFRLPPNAYSVRFYPSMMAPGLQQPINTHWITASVDFSLQIGKEAQEKDPRYMFGFEYTPIK